jgi:hypothetical protein
LFSLVFTYLISRRVAQDNNLLNPQGAPVIKL